MMVAGRKMKASWRASQKLISWAMPLRVCQRELSLSVWNGIGGNWYWGRLMMRVAVGSGGQASMHSMVEHGCLCGTCPKDWISPTVAWECGKGKASGHLGDQFMWL